MQQEIESAYIRIRNGERNRLIRSIHLGPAEYGNVVRKVYPNHMTLTAQEFEQAATGVIADTQAAIAELQTQYAHEAVPGKKSFYKRLIELKEVYLKTCELLQNPIVVKNIGDLDLFEVVLPAANQFHAFASVIGAIRLDLGPRPKGKRQEVTLNTHLKDRCGPNRLRGVLGAILARACFAKYLLKGKPVMDVARAIVEKMTPEAVLTAPFCAM